VAGPDSCGILRGLCGDSHAQARRAGDRPGKTSELDRNPRFRPSGLGGNSAGTGAWHGLFRRARGTVHAWRKRGAPQRTISARSGRESGPNARLVSDRRPRMTWIRRSSWQSPTSHPLPRTKRPTPSASSPPHPCRPCLASRLHVSSTPEVRLPGEPCRWLAVGSDGQGQGRLTRRRRW
jgi:hypothetical protein